MSINTQHLQNLLLPRPHSARSLDSESGIYHLSKVSRFSKASRLRII